MNNKNIKKKLNFYKSKLGKVLAIFIFSIGVRYYFTNSLYRNSGSESDQSVERVTSQQSFFLEEKLINNKEEIFSQNCSTPLVVTGSSKIFCSQNISQSSKAALEIRSGDLNSKSGPGAKAKADAARNVKAGRYSSNYNNIFAEAFTNSKVYQRYHPAGVSYKTPAKVSRTEFENENPGPDDSTNGNDDYPFADESRFYGGPKPFEKYQYQDPEKVSKKIGFSESSRLNKSFDKHAKDCFQITANRNKKSLEIFKKRVLELAESADKVHKGSYRFKDPAYIFLKNNKENVLTAVVVNATNNEFITVVNPTPNQKTNLRLYDNIGLDQRPSKQLILRLRGPKHYQPPI